MIPTHKCEGICGRHSYSPTRIFRRSSVHSATIWSTNAHKTLTTRPHRFPCLTVVSRRLHWAKWNPWFIPFFRQLKVTNRTLTLAQKRCWTRTVSGIIDAFHFQLTNDPTNGEGQRITRAIQKHLLPMILRVLSQNSFSLDTLTNRGRRRKTPRSMINVNKLYFWPSPVSWSPRRWSLYFVHFCTRFVTEH